MGRSILSRRGHSNSSPKSKTSLSSQRADEDNGSEEDYDSFYPSSSPQSKKTPGKSTKLRRKLFRKSSDQKKSKSSISTGATTVIQTNRSGDNMSAVLDAALRAPSNPSLQQNNAKKEKISTNQSKVNNGINAPNSKQSATAARNISIAAITISHSSSSTEDEEDEDPAAVLINESPRKGKSQTSATTPLKQKKEQSITQTPPPPPKDALTKFKKREIQRLKELSQNIQKESAVNKNTNKAKPLSPPVKHLEVSTTPHNKIDSFSANWENMKTPLGMKGWKNLPQSPRPPPTPSTLIQNLPDSPQKRRAELLTLTRSALSRPFGRTSLPSFLAKKWQVEVSPAEWSNETQQWNYKIIVQKDVLYKDSHCSTSFFDYQNAKLGNGWVSKPQSSPMSQMNGSMEDGTSLDMIKTSSSSNSSAFSTACTTRTLQDFVWLEGALRMEFHGGLILPLLENALQVDSNVDRQGSDGKSGSYLEEIMEKNEEVDGRLLADWLSDVLNGVRGHGEILLTQTVNHNGSRSGDGAGGGEEGVDLISCESMETFLYRNTDSSAVAPTNGGGSNGEKGTTSRASSLGEMVGDSENIDDFAQTGICQNIGNRNTNADGKDQLGIMNLMARPFACFDYQESCGGSSSNRRAQSDKEENAKMISSSLSKRLPLNTMQFSSRLALKQDEEDGDGNQTHLITPRVGTSNGFPNTPNFFSPNETFNNKNITSSQYAIHSELLEAERELISCHLRSATKARHTLRLLLDEEAHVSAAWKRFAISLSNLFAFEKDLENSRVGAEYNTGDGDDSTKKIKRIQPFKKLSKSVVDDHLRVLARQKMDRSMPSLKVLSGMLNAFIADLCSVDPALRAYSIAVAQLAQLDQQQHHDQEDNMSYVTGNYAGSISTFGNTYGYDESTRGGVGGGGWQAQLRAIGASLRLVTHRTNSARAYNNNNSSSSVVAENQSEGGILIGQVTTVQKRAFEERVVSNETLLKSNLTALCRASPIRTARMAWKVFKMEAGQASLLDSAASSLRFKISVDPETATSMREAKKADEESATKDDEAEIAIVKRILEIGNNSKRFGGAGGSHTMQHSRSDTSSNDASAFTEDDDNSVRIQLCEKAIRITSQRVGRWDAQVALAIMEAVGVEDAEVRVEETTRDLRFVRKYAIGLRENVERCVEAVQLLSSIVLSEDENDGKKKPKNVNQPSTDDFSQFKGTTKLKESRQDFLSALASVFSGVILTDSETKNTIITSKSALPSTSVLSSVGIDTTDPAGWRSAMQVNGQVAVPSYRDQQGIRSGKSGSAALEYQKVRDKDVAALLGRIAKLLLDYEKRVEEIESFVYMHCVGIQLEKHFSNLRSKALAAWEKKTDITTAINIATRKRLPLLVKELQSKLESLSPHVSHTTVKHAKEKHLTSKNLKTDLQSLADRRFQRAKETATERVIAIMAMWAQHEENNARGELETLGETIREIERAVTEEHIEADGGAHLFAAKGAGSAAASLVTASRSVR